MRKKVGARTESRTTAKLAAATQSSTRVEGDASFGTDVKWHDLQCEVLGCGRQKKAAGVCYSDC